MCRKVEKDMSNVNIGEVYMVIRFYIERDIYVYKVIRKACVNLKRKISI